VNFLRARRRPLNDFPEYYNSEGFVLHDNGRDLLNIVRGVDVYARELTQKISASKPSNLCW